MTGTVKTKHILVVEDDEMFRILLRDMFWIHSTHDCMIEVVTKRSLIEGRAYLNDTQTLPDIIFLGLWLLTPHADGVMTRETIPTLEFIKELKGDERYKHMIIVVYSRFNEIEFKEKAREVGADHYLVKGELTPREIVDFVEHL
jgi:DNA-binding NarL/FixJ family response regulator